MSTSKLPVVGTILSRVEAPTVKYRVTTILGTGRNASARILPFRSRGREILVGMLGGAITGDGSVWLVA
jgi:hypothetical protein